MPRLPTLPVPRSTRQKWWAGVWTAAACAVLYTASSALTRERALPIAMFDWEQAIDFWPITVWAYLAQYPMLLVAFGSCRDLARCGRFLYAALLVQASAAAIYLIYPIRYPRPALPPMEDLDRYSAALVRAVHAIDAPVNCCPSLHVTSCLLCLWLIAGQSRAFVRIFAAATVVCIASTLTFKQHYFIDLPLGALLAWAGWALAGRLTRSRPARARPLQP